MNKELQYYPKGGRCSACANKWQDCSQLDFKDMPVYRKDDYGVCVICTHFIKEQKSYYGTTTDFNKAEECRKLVEEIGIDFEKTKPVREEYDFKFNGTDVDSVKVVYLEGVLKTTDGTKWEWYLEFEENINILELIKNLVPDPFAK